MIAPPFLRGVGYKFSERFGVRLPGGRFCDSHIGDLYNSGSRAPALQGSDGGPFPCCAGARGAMEVGPVRLKLICENWSKLRPWD